MAKGVAGSIQRVMHFFLPREEEFFGLFAQMSEQAYQAALLLQKMFQDYPEVGDVVAGIAELEHGVDTLRHDCTRRLNETFVTPIMFDRQDILDLADTLDDVVDFTRAAVDRTTLYRVQTVPEGIHQLCRVLVECTRVLAEACQRLGELRPTEGDFVQRVNELENQGDQILKQGLADLFHNETNPVEVIKWKEIYDYVEEAIDHCEDTVSVIEAALVKNS
jgi:predicted phosphate transport protein (TIGR00153 family)